ncbi:MAG: hypothetical protein K6U11_13600 [bacterium]|nr:hypothetical protein [bacterium]
MHFGRIHQIIRFQPHPPNHPLIHSSTHPLSASSTIRFFQPHPPPIHFQHHCLSNTRFQLNIAPDNPIWAEQDSNL